VSFVRGAERMSVTEIEQTITALAYMARAASRRGL
jgi:hypothetical protein